MAKTQTLSNTAKAAINTLIDLGNQQFSYFDEGITEGSGIWYSALRDEMNYSTTLNARAITKLVKDGMFIKSDRDEDGEEWLELTAKGAKAALSFKDDKKFKIVEEAAAPTTRKAPTAKGEAAGTGCKCGCGTQVQGKKALYRPGHDAKHVSRLVAETRTTGKQPAEASLLSTRLFAKFVKALTK
ncbi:hypothetical protein SEA_BIGMACK_54 [Arthrobacter phage BigMack]|uniref:Uncharacterized protein n=1 Tax=Arthrobacter phage BigMack TaxID=2488953 RepID=A0A3G8FV59_9CAUD|nr:hypothetical protein KDI95_gp54 [Arthrobacter phage BigMack]AZF98455.1 hypothetical protein SEA_BIGMACK_54 [Arthrobacter phage BigMack]